MRSANHIPVYNARIPDMLIPARFPRLANLLFILLLAPRIMASDWQAPSEQLARKIAAATGPGAVALEVMNRSSLSQADVDEIRRRLTTELDALGVHLVNADQAPTSVRVSLSENLQNYVWVAEIHQGSSEPALVMVASPRPATALAEGSSAALTIHKALLWVDENRILDVAIVNGSPQHMVLLEPESVVIYRLQESHWQQEQSLPISHPHVWPRDLRGRLALRKDHLFDAYLPGMFCRSTAVAPLALNCRESDDPWPIGTAQFSLSAFFAPTRNFFTGALSPGIAKQTTAPAFYSAAPLPRDKYTPWVFTAVDGQVHLLDGATDQASAKLGWGSDAASVRTGCGLGWQILATANLDGPTDVVKAFEFPDREPVAVSQPVEFNGKITALWTDADGASVLAVSQNSETERYEVYRLSITCGL